MDCGLSLKLFVLLLVAHTAKSVPLKNHLVKFYPISRSQYDSVLRMTAGRPVISEGRLINSGFRPFNELRTAFSSDISSSLNQILSLTGLRFTNTKPSRERVDGYPLCVIKTNGWGDNDEDSMGDKDNHENEMKLGHTRDANDEQLENDKRPMVSCIVVVKPKDKTMDGGKTEKKKQEPVDAFQRPRTPIFAPQYYYPTFEEAFRGYPPYPYYGYPFYPEARASNSKINALPIAETAPEKKIPKSQLKETSIGRSGYESYPGYYPYTSVSGYQQSYPYNFYYGGCNQYGYLNGYNGYYDGDDSDEDDEYSDEVNDEIGGEKL